MAVTVITPPATDPVTLDEAKIHCRVEADHVEDDALIAGLITTAREYCEGVQQRAYVTQTLELALDRFPSCGFIELPRPPLQEVVSVTYTDKDGVETVWDPANYLVDTRSYVGRICLAYGKSWPTATLQPVNGVAIQYQAGYGEASAVPQRFKLAIMLLVGYWYENREVAGKVGDEIAFSVRTLLSLDPVF